MVQKRYIIHHPRTAAGMRICAAWLDMPAFVIAVAEGMLGELDAAVASFDAETVDDVGAMAVLVSLFW